MATKWRKFSRSKPFKAALFMLVVLLVSTVAFYTVKTLLTIQNLDYTNDFYPEAVLGSEYTDSNEFLDNVRYTLNLVCSYTFDPSLVQGYDNYHLLLDDNAKSTLVVPDIDIPNGVIFYGETATDSLSNCNLSTLAEFSSRSAYYIAWENEELLFGAGLNTRIRSAVIRYDIPRYNIRRMYIAFLPSYFMERESNWQLSEKSVTPELRMTIGCLAVALLGFIILLFVTGRSPDSDEVTVGYLGHIYSDILLAMLIALSYGLYMSLYSIELNISAMASEIICWMAFGSAFIFFTCVLALFLALARKLKRGIFTRHSLIYTVCRLIYRFFAAILRGVGSFFTELFSSRDLSKPFAATICIMLLGGVPLYLCLAVVLIEFILCYFYVKSNNRVFSDMQEIDVQTEHIADGELLYVPPLAPDSEFAELSSRLSNIGEGLQKALDRQLSSERMKIDLVANVSHDLKTPLTSIIGYIDLLKQDGSLSPEAQDYVEILSQKSLRLKSMIEDLFDLARTTSGDAPLTLETLDFRRLIEQTIADMEDKIDAAMQTIRCNIYPAPLYIRGDGNKLYRVVQNVIDNALKYSMPGTRIFIELESSGLDAVLSVKNTARYEMDFSAEEVLERFSRGDKSRSTEGSGLGLSIANSFTNACGGQFDVQIDGDQFKVLVRFPTVQPPETRTAETAEELPEESSLPEALPESYDEPEEDLAEADI